MSKKDEAKNDNQPSVKGSRKLKIKQISAAIVLIAAAVLGYKLWQNPQLLYQLRDIWTERQTKEDIYEQQLSGLQQQITSLQGQLAEVGYLAAHPDLSGISKRIDDIEQINLNTIKSKADVGAVLGLVMRMDNAEGRLNDLAKVSDDSALTLTAAMLVKDAAARGGSFVYEAEVLSELAAGNYKIADEVARINEIAPQGVPSLKDLQRQFAEIYVVRYLPEEKTVPAGNWKERLYRELTKVVQVKQSSEMTEKELSEEDRAWNIVRDYVDEGEITRALAIIHKPLNARLAEDKDLRGWIEAAERYRDFYNDISRISANALAVMKVKFLRHKDAPR